MGSRFNFRFRVFHWPLVTCLWFTITFIVTFVLSLALDHVYWYFPFISDTGTIQPESCIFAQLLNLGAILLGIVVYVRYREVQAAIDCGLITISHRLNNASLWCGLLSCLGLSIVGNFQQNATYVSFMHFFGALGSFGIGGIYFILQTIISYQYTISNFSSNSCNFKLGRNTFYFRVFLAVFFLPLYFTCTICGVLAISKFTGDNKIYWKPDDGGFELRLTATFTEWILVIFELCYVITFTKEFKNVKYRGVIMECKFAKG